MIDTPTIQEGPSNGLVAGPCRQAVIPDSVTRYPIVNAIADPNHTPTTSWLARESGSGNQSPTGILTTSGVSSVSRGHYTRGRDTDAGVAGPYRGGRAGRPVALSTRIASNGFLPDPRCTPGGHIHRRRTVSYSRRFLSFLRPLRARARARQVFSLLAGYHPSVGAHRRPQRVGSAFSHHLVQSPNGHPRLLRSVASPPGPRTDFAYPLY